MRQFSMPDMGLRRAHGPHGIFENIFKTGGEGRLQPRRRPRGTAAPPQTPAKKFFGTAVRRAFCRSPMSRMEFWRTGSLGGAVRCRALGARPTPAGAIQGQGSPRLALQWPGRGYPLDFDRSSEKYDPCHFHLHAPWPIAMVPYTLHITASLAFPAQLSSFHFS